MLLPQGITEFATAGMLTGVATVNFSEKPEKEFNGFLGACSTYGSFVYLKYGSFRLYSQLAQDCQLKTGKILWVAGHSGPETADDFRTHFGIFSPGVTQLFPEGQIVNLHPWEYNEVPVVLAAALKRPAPLIALHLTRPAIPIPDRAALGMPSHFEAAKGAYVVRDYPAGPPRRLRHRPGHQRHGEHRRHPARAAEAGPQRQDRGGHQPRALRHAAAGLPRRRALATATRPTACASPPRPACSCTPGSSTRPPRSTP